MSTRARSREFGEFVVIGREVEVDLRVEKDGCAAEVDCRRLGKERRDVEYVGRGPEIECREVVGAGTTFMSCEVDRSDVKMEGSVLEVCKGFLYAALDFRIGFSGTAEL